MTKSGRPQEAELANALEDDHGYAAFRCGASGSATERARPDVIALRDGHSFAIEVKQAREGEVYLQSHEIPELLDFAARAGGTAVVAVRPSFQFKRFDSWQVYPADTVRESSGDSYVIDESDHDRAKSIPEFFDGGEP